MSLLKSGFAIILIFTSLSLWAAFATSHDIEDLYIDGELVPQSILDTFEHINPWHLDGNSWVQNYGYRKDENNVYIHDGHTQDWSPQYYTLPNVDPDTFEIIELEIKPENLWRAYYDMYTTWWVSIGYTKDASHVYYKNKLIPKADPLTYKTLLWGYFIDKDSVYSHNDDMPSRLIHVDVDTFEVLWVDELWEEWETSSWFYGKYYARDKNNLFYKGNIVQWADPDDFTKLNDFGYYVSNDFVLHHWRVIPWVSESDFSTQNYIVPLAPEEPVKGTSPDGIALSLPWADTTKNYWFYVFNNKIFTPHWKVVSFLHTNKLKLHELWITDDNMFYIEYYHTYGQFSSYREHFKIKFLPKHADVIDLYMKESVASRMTVETLVKKLELYKESRPEDYMEWWTNDVLIWALVDHVLENGYTYYQ